MVDTVLHRTTYRERVLDRIEQWWNQESENERHGIHSKKECTRTVESPTKLQGTSLYCCSYWQRRLSNKLNAKYWVQSMDIPVAQLYWSGHDVRTIPFSQLPSCYVIRPTAGSGSCGVLIMKDGRNLRDGQKYSFEKCKRFLEKYQQQQQQRGIRTDFIVEQFVQTLEGNYDIPSDYKIHMFGEKVGIIQRVTISDHHKGKHQLYDQEWKTFPHPYLLCYPFDKVRHSPPPHLEEMLQYARRLGKSYGTYVRIDFFETPVGPVFCEFTPTPCLGLHVTEPGNQYLVKLWNNMILSPEVTENLLSPTSSEI